MAWGTLLQLKIVQQGWGIDMRAKWEEMWLERLSESSKSSCVLLKEFGFYSSVLNSTHVDPSVFYFI